ncbi:hypothetical protein ABKN59_010813 [Abortiporus biennis]
MMLGTRSERTSSASSFLQEQLRHRFTVPYVWRTILQSRDLKSVDGLPVLHVHAYPVFHKHSIRCWING